jgi:hypothetical protein
MDRFSGCGGSVTTGGCINPSCMQGPGGYYVNGQKVAPVHATLDALSWPPLPIWYEVTGRGSGKKLDGLHVANVERPYGQMTTGCGVGISSAVVVTRPRPG